MDPAPLFTGIMVFARCAPEKALPPVNRSRRFRRAEYRSVPEKFAPSIGAGLKYYGKAALLPVL